jgi:hypothetical protein
MRIIEVVALCAALGGCGIAARVDARNDYQSSAAIHLLNAQIVMGNQLSGNGFSWRLKLSAVDGICIGNMTAS